YNYIRYTGDENYMLEAGLEVLIAISRFWAQRVNKSSVNGKYMILGVTGPNEYENNVNNNWYTNKIAAWCLKYTIESLQYLQKNAPGQLDRLLRKVSFSDTEIQNWETIARDMYFPEWP